MKPLKPSMRKSRRYLLISGNSSFKRVEKVILEFVGILGLAEADLKYIKKLGKNFVISIDNRALNKVRASFAIPLEKIDIKKVSGTIKGLGKK